MKQIMVAMVAALAGLAGCSSGSGTAAPAPTVTVTAAPTPAEPTPADDDVAMLDEIWHSYSPKERSTMCDGYDIAPESMWRSFSKNTDMVTRAQFMAFLEQECV